MSVMERFWSKVDRDGPAPEHRPDLGSCWVWTASTRNGYGAFAPERTQVVYVHRFAYELLVGPIPEGLQLDHLCRNPLCLRPLHLEPVTQAENIRRGVGASAINAAKTHCPRGHLYGGPDTYITPAGHRQCRACKRARAAKAAAS